MMPIVLSLLSWVDTDNIFTTILQLLRFQHDVVEMLESVDPCCNLFTTCWRYVVKRNAGVFLFPTCWKIFVYVVKKLSSVDPEKPG